MHSFIPHFVNHRDHSHISIPQCSGILDHSQSFNFLRFLCKSALGNEANRKRKKIEYTLSFLQSLLITVEPLIAAIFGDQA